jgi:lipoprotein LprG
MRKARWILYICVVFTLAVSSTGCKKSTPVPLPPAEIIANAIDRLKGCTGFHFTIERTGTLAYIDLDNKIAVDRIEGDFVTPDRVEGKIRVSVSGFPAEVSIVSIQGRYWQTNPINQTWEEYEPGTVFNPAILFDAEMGIQPMLQADLTGVTLAGNEKLEKWPDKQLYHLKGKMKGERIAEVTFGLIGPEVLDVEVWVAPQTFEVHRILIIDPIEGEPEPTSWTIDFLNYDQKADIQPPVP